MKRAIRWAWLVFLAAIMTAVLPPAWGVTPAAPDAVAQTVNAGYLENVTFERLPGKERVTLAVSKQSGVTVENQPGNSVLVRMENLFVPEGLRRPLSDAALVNVVRVTPVQKTAEGRSWVIATIDLKQKVPYSVRQEGMNILIEFNVTSVAAAEHGDTLRQDVPVLPLPVVQTPAARTAEKSATPGGEDAREVAGNAGKETKGYGGPKILLDVQDADIKAVLRLLSEQGNVSIVSGDDVKGTVTLKIKDVSWEQALDTILTITGLGKRQVGNIITVMSLEKMKKSETDRAALEKEKAKKEEADQLKEPHITRVVPISYNKPEELKKNIEELLKSMGGAQDSKDPKQPTDSKAASNPGSVTVDTHTRSLIIKATRRDMDSLLRFIERIDKPTTQILIKANIVETTKSTARNLGIQWGGMWGQKIGSQGLYVTPGGTGGSAVPPGSAFSGGYSPTSGVAGIAGQGYGVNFPAAQILGAGPASLGVMFGRIGANILEVQLSAMQKDGKLNILSSPSLVTLDNQTAYTENGEDVPFVTPGTSTSPPTVTWKKAVLRLEIKPHVIDGKNINMTIFVKKDEPNYAQSVQGNPPLIVKETKTELVVADGDTIVISGLTKQKKDESISGLPWLKDIPVLGWLFKGEGKSESMEEVLIFITPTIIKPQTVAGIQEGA
ncbi:MAG: type IV pilus secretin PilQ [Pseudomonadota bacterium]